jgi:hypothetical protein
VDRKNKLNVIIIELIINNDIASGYVLGCVTFYSAINNYLGHGSIFGCIYPFQFKSENVCRSSIKQATAMYRRWTNKTGTKMTDT